jgi:hypothetical protein
MAGTSSAKTRFALLRGHDDLFQPAVFRNLPMSTAVSPLAPTDVPDMPVISGVKLATAAAGIRYKGRTDVLLAVMDKGTAVAGVFTKSKCPSAPVEWCRAKLKGGRARALVTPMPLPARPGDRRRH